MIATTAMAVLRTLFVNALVIESELAMEKLY